MMKDCGCSADFIRKALSSHDPIVMMCIWHSKSFQKRSQKFSCFNSFVLFFRKALPMSHKRKTYSELQFDSGVWQQKADKKHPKELTFNMWSFLMTFRSSFVTDKNFRCMRMRIYWTLFENVTSRTKGIVILSLKRIELCLHAFKEEANTLRL